MFWLEFLEASCLPAAWEISSGPALWPLVLDRSLIWLIQYKVWFLSFSLFSDSAPDILCLDMLRAPCPDPPKQATIHTHNPSWFQWRLKQCGSGHVVIKCHRVTPDLMVTLEICPPECSNVNTAVQLLWSQGYSFLHWVNPSHIWSSSFPATFSFS